MKYVPSFCLLFRDTQNWDGLHPYPMSPFSVVDISLGEARGTRHWVLHGELWQQKLLGTVPFSPLTSSKVAPFRSQEAKSASGKTFLSFQ